MTKSGLVPKQVFNFVGYRFDLISGRVFTHSGPLAGPSEDVESHKEPSQVYGSSVHVSDRSLDGHREAGLSRSTSYETHTMASQETQAFSRSLGKGYSSPSFTTPSFGLVVGAHTWGTSLQEAFGLLWKVSFT